MRCRDSKDVEEGPFCLGASRGSRSNKEIGGWRSRRCYREDLARAGVAGAGVKGASAGGCVWWRDGRRLRRASAASE